MLEKSSAFQPSSNQLLRLNQECTERKRLKATFAVCSTVNGGWSSWSSWSECHPRCSKAGQKRTRACTNPAPMNGGQNCLGPAQQKMDCNIGCPGEFLEFIISSTHEERKPILAEPSPCQPAGLRVLLFVALQPVTSPEDYLTCKRAERCLFSSSCGSSRRANDRRVGFAHRERRYYRCDRREKTLSLDL